MEELEGAELEVRRAVRTLIQVHGVSASGTLFQCCAGHYSDEPEVWETYLVLPFRPFQQQLTLSFPRDDD